MWIFIISENFKVFFFFLREEFHSHSHTGLLFFSPFKGLLSVSPSLVSCTAESFKLLCLRFLTWGPQTYSRGSPKKEIWKRRANLCHLRHSNPFPTPFAFFLRGPCRNSLKGLQRKLPQPGSHCSRLAPESARRCTATLRSAVSWNLGL